MKCLGVNCRMTSLYILFSWNLSSGIKLEAFQALTDQKRSLDEDLH